MERMKELIELLNKASKAYYQEATEIMSDYEYDKLYDELLKLEKSMGVVLSGSPTQNVGYTVLSGLKKVQHETRMLSLDKTKEVSRLKSFLGEEEGILSLKLDGLTIVLTYKNGELFQAVTRGNGDIGEDITHNARVFKNLPLKISYKDELVIRGEAVISFKNFIKINDELPEEERYKNPRNLCSGTVRQLNSETAAKRSVSFIAFSLISNGTGIPNDLKENRMNFLKELGFTTVETKLVNSTNIEEAVSEFEKKLPKNEFASDGLVLTYNDISYSSSLGATSKFPRDSIAFKWKDELAETTLIDIYWNTSRTGLINPIAIFEPVELEGTTVNKASLHNLSIVEGLKLGKGDRITVYKANMIIPQVAENLTQSGTFEIPKKCLVCGETTEIVKLRDGKALKCTNPNCKAQIVMELVHYTSRDALNIEGISESTFEKFVKCGFVENYTDLYEIEKYKEDILSMDGFGEKSFLNMLEAIEKSKNTHLFRFIYGLGINHVGLSNAKLLCKFFNNDFEKIMTAKPEELIEIEGFGEVIAKSVSKYFENEENVQLIKKALNYLTFIYEEEVNTDEQLLSGLNFVITGDVYNYKNRKELQAEIESLGGKVTGSVTGKTNYLINNDINSSSSKNKKAHELNVPIITENEFMKLIKK